jgi:hypothetical protein
MIAPRHLDVLRKIRARLEHADVNWVVTGSVGFALQGVPVSPDDLDIQTDEAGAYEIERLFSEFVVRKVAFSSAERIRSHFGVLSVDGVTVELMGDIQKKRDDGSWDNPVDLDRHKRVVEIEGISVPVLSLEYECDAYKRLGRTDKAAMLERWLRRDEWRSLRIR